MPELVGNFMRHARAGLLGAATAVLGSLTALGSTPLGPHRLPLYAAPTAPLRQPFSSAASSTLPPACTPTFAGLTARTPVTRDTLTLSSARPIVRFGADTKADAKKESVTPPPHDAQRLKTLEARAEKAAPYSALKWGCYAGTGAALLGACVMPPIGLAAPALLVGGLLFRRQQFHVMPRQDYAELERLKESLHPTTRNAEGTSSSSHRRSDSSSSFWPFWLWATTESSHHHRDDSNNDAAAVDDPSDPHHKHKHHHHSPSEPTPTDDATDAGHHKHHHSIFDIFSSDDHPHHSTDDSHHHHHSNDDGGGSWDDSGSGGDTYYD
jgi:hypothetical protein